MLELIDPYEVWKHEFGIHYHSITNALPNFIEGKTPGIDIQTFTKSNSVQSAWYTYPMYDFSLEFWELFEMGRWYGFTAKLSTATQLSQTIGISMPENLIPALWVLYLEK